MIQDYATDQIGRQGYRPQIIQRGFMVSSHNPEMEAVRATEKYLLATLICAGVAIVDGYDIVSLGFAVPLLTKEWGCGPAAFTAALTSGSVGMLVGALACGVLADRYGRKAVLMGCVVLFGVASALTIFVTSPGELTFARAITGFGLGGGVPVAIALVTDISPPSRQSGLVMLMSVGMAVGGLAGGYLVSTFLIGPYGWKSIFLLGGIAPLLYLPALLFLPGSARTDMVAPGKTDSIEIIGSLFRNGYAALTLTLWAIVALNFLII
jgi:AAHS family 4-hydroxybenzoate transporter-like MFS transporter